MSQEIPKPLNEAEMEKKKIEEEKRIIKEAENREGIKDEEEGTESELNKIIEEERKGTQKEITVDERTGEMLTPQDIKERREKGFER
ncbi:MAG: hypothetical protein HYW34_01765 [Candidatus Brennerbacteria bacterium]|nr:hypothetical protein [Candidatus Brennerbacteria bacterium]